MDQHAQWHVNQKMNRAATALEANQYAVHLLNDKEELLELLKVMLPQKATISVGGSMTLFETGVMDLLRSGDYEFWDRYASGLQPADIRKLYIKSFDADYYFTSSNAITEEGTLFNVDGTGNRVASMIYGPKQVYVIAGVNKIVKDLDAAIARNREVAAPTNAKRLNRKTPCAQTGICSDCKSPERICADYVLMGRQSIPNRIHVFLVNDHFGY